jgi:hypothetical protein
MKTKIKYVLIKESLYKKIESYDFNESFTMTKKKDDERIGIIKFYDDEVISRVIKRSIDNRFKKLLELIADIEESDEDPSQGYLFCLDEAEKFKREMINKYNKFLKKTQLEFINKKIELIEKDMKNKLIAYRLLHSPIFSNMEMEEDELEDERTRSR